MINLDMGKVFTFLPENVPEEEAIEFEFGGKLEPVGERIPLDSGFYMEETPGSDLNLVDEINSHLKNSIGNICVMEDQLAEPGDPGIKECSSRLLFYKKEVYHFLLSSDTDVDRILDTIGESSSPGLFIGYMTSFPGDFRTLIEDNRYISEDVLTVFAERVEELFVEVYDGEGYIIWIKNKDESSKP